MSVVIPIVHSGEPSRVVADALKALLEDVFAESVEPRLLGGHSAVLEDYSACPFAIFSLNALNRDDPWLNAAAGAVYTSSPGERLTRICPVMLAGSLNDDLFSRFQGLSINDGPGILVLRDEIPELIRSVAGAVGLSVPDVDWTETVSVFRSRVSPARGLLAAAFRPETPEPAPADLQLALRQRIGSRRPQRERSSYTVFVSWSKDASRLVGRVVRDFAERLSDDQVKVYYSPLEIGRGEQWLEHFAAGLRDSDAAVFCLSEANMEAPWLCFEFGALVASRRAPVLANLRVDGAAPEGLFWHVPHAFRAGSQWERTGNADGALEYVEVDRTVEFHNMLTILGIDPSGVGELGTELNEALSSASSGDIVRVLSIRATESVDFDVDLDDYSANAPYFVVEDIAEHEAEQLARAKLSGAQISTLIEKIVASTSREFHSRGFEFGWSPALLLLSQLAQNDAIDADGCRVIFQYLASHLPQLADELMQVAWALKHAPACPADLIERIDVVLDGGLLDTGSISIADTPIDQLASLSPPTDASRVSVDELVADVIGQRRNRTEALTRSRLRPDCGEALARLHRALRGLQAAHPGDIDLHIAIRTYLEEYAGRLPPTLEVLRLTYGIRPASGLLAATYRRSFESARAMFALETTESELVEDLCLSDPSDWVRRNVTRNSNVAAAVWSVLEDDVDSRVRDSALARAFLESAEDEIAPLVHAYLDRDLHEAHQDGLALVCAGRQLRFEELAPDWDLDGSWTEFALRSPIGHHITSRLGWSEAAAREYVNSDAVLARMTPLYLLSYLQNRQTGAYSDGELNVPFPAPDPFAPGSSDAGEAHNTDRRRAQLELLRREGYELRPIS